MQAQKSSIIQMRIIIFFLHYAIIDILKSPFIGIDKGTEPYH